MALITHKQLKHQISNLIRFFFVCFQICSVRLFSKYFQISIVNAVRSAYLTPQCPTSCLPVIDNIHEIKKRKVENWEIPQSSHLKKNPTILPVWAHSMPVLNVVSANLHSKRSRCSVYKTEDEAKCWNSLGSLQSNVGN